MSKEIISIKFTDWKVTQEKLKNRPGTCIPWFKLGTGFLDRFEGRKNAILVYIYLCIRAAKTGTDELFIDVENGAKEACQTKNEFIKSINLLSSLGILIIYRVEKSEDKSRADQISISDEPKQINENVKKEEFELPAIAVLWNRTRSEKQGSVKLTPKKRSDAIKIAMKEIPNLDDWEIIFKNIAKNKWCNGENDSNWIASFDYAIRVDKALKYLETPVRKMPRPMTTEEILAPDVE